MNDIMLPVIWRQRKSIFLNPKAIKSGGAVYGINTHAPFEAMVLVGNAFSPGTHAQFAWSNLYHCMGELLVPCNS